MERQFKGVWIPAKVWQDSRLTATAKMLYAEIDSFTGNSSMFWKTNETIASDLGVSIATVKRAIATLRKLGLIEEGQAFNGRTRYLISTAAEMTSTLTAQIEPAQIEPPVSSKRPGRRVKKTLQAAQIEPQNIQSQKIELPCELSESQAIEFHILWEEYLEYRKVQHGFKYKTIKHEQLAIHRLWSESGESLETCRRAIADCIANGWRGLFPRPNRKTGPTIDPGAALAWANS